MREPDFLIQFAALIFIFCSLYFLVKARYCAKCHAKLPLFRRPNSLRQVLLGGWTCAKCGSELDREGNLISKDRKRKSYK